ncbi:MAG: energy coupling factor transporter S component ThiW [Clostridiales bacterium]|jgi:energy coupling factor transporter S component ThiW|nr:energy coupling factor transporter S component ThiW [Clostridiales bacterium]
MPVKKLTSLALLIALGTAAGVFSFPVAGARIFPVQHAINVLAAVLFGPAPAVLVAFCVALLRNLLGTGSILAFPGGMFGALTAGIFYRYSGRESLAAIGEVAGTGFLGALAAVPAARLLLGRDVLALAYVIPFTVSSLSGAAAGLLLLRFVAAPERKSMERV